MTAVTGSSERAQAAEFSLLARRNNSLSSAGRHLVLAFLVAVSVGIGAAFAALGAWPILPFAGLEMLVLFLAFRYVDRHAADYEYIAIEADTLRLEMANGGALKRFEFNRCWARVALREEGAQPRLAVRYKGEEYRLGRHLDDQGRRALARDLACRLRG